MRRRENLLSFTAVLALLGFLVVVQLRSQAADDRLNALSVPELGELVANLTTRNDQLRDEIRVLDGQRAAVEAAQRRGGTSAGQIRADLDRVLGWSGALGVVGPGVRVTVEGEVPGDAVEQLLNELRNAGAEAITVDNIRVVPGVVVTGPAGSLVVAGVPLVEPVEILAVGRAETLSGTLTRAGGPIAQLGARHPETLITVTAADRLELPPTDRDLAPTLGSPRL
jgi:uncharacterized protein YlxW (UPF0749 family)